MTRARLSRPVHRGLLATGLTIAMLVLPFAAPSAAAQSLNDREIADAVENEFRYDPAVPLDPIDVTSLEGVVTLQGTTSNILAKERAAKIAQTVKGVRAVVNEIEVRLPVAKNAENLREDVALALSNDPATEIHEVSVVADNAGRVTLSGTVDSAQERELVATVAKSVSGVTALDNQIDVAAAAADRPDSEIRSEIMRRFYWDVLIDSQRVDVNVKDGQVTLSGVVGSAAERQRALRIAQVAGVSDIKASELMVQDWARDPNRVDPDRREVSDEEIAAAVKDALLFDPRVSLFNISVEVEDGITTLRGTVHNLAAKRSAEQDAHNTVGVERVVNRIKVRPAEDSVDNAIETQVLAALQRDPYVEQYEITVSANAGVVDLYGMVDTYFEKSRADMVAERVVGVVAVDNNIVVRDDRTPLTYDPYLGDYPPERYGWYDYSPDVTYRSDREIRESIESELWWSPFVDSDEVEVAVEDGTATLTGTVDSVSEWQAASENAWEGGATWVVNEMEITDGGA